MVRKLRWVAMALVVLALASLLALYSYGRFAERARGEPGHALPVQASGTGLDRAIQPLTAANEGKSGLLLVADNVDAFALRAAVARAATRSLDLQYYIWHHDLTGMLLVDEVLRAADRGVRVRLLLDDLNAHGQDSGLAALDTHQNVEVRMFNPSRSREGTLGRALEMALRLVSMNRRMHNKAWIADGRVAIVGGRNIGNEYFDAAAESNFLDLDVALLGPAVQQTEAIFDDFWNSESVIPLDALVQPRPGALTRLRDGSRGRSEADLARPFLDQLQGPGRMLSLPRGELPVYWVERAYVHSDPAAKGQGGGQERWLSGVLEPIMSAAQQELRLISPYFVPGVDGANWLRSLTARGVDVGVLTNSLAATDVVAVHGGYANYRVPLLMAGVDIYELMPHGRPDSSLFGSSGASLHTKAFAVDGIVGFIGSFNLDPRSVSLNTEMGVVFEDPDLTAELLRSYATKSAPEHSYRVMLENGSLRWQDASVQPPKSWTREPESSAWRRTQARFMRWLPIESQL